jgi:hypothetical protein
MGIVGPGRQLWVARFCLAWEDLHEATQAVRLDGKGPAAYLLRTERCAGPTNATGRPPAPDMISPPL